MQHVALTKTVAAVTTTEATTGTVATAAAATTKSTTTIANTSTTTTTTRQRNSAAVTKSHHIHQKKNFAVHKNNLQKLDNIRTSIRSHNVHIRNTVILILFLLTETIRKRIPWLALLHLKPFFLQQHDIICAEHSVGKVFRSDLLVLSYHQRQVANIKLIFELKYIRFIFIFLKVLLDMLSL